MSILIFTLLSSLGFAALDAQSAWAHSQSTSITFLIGAMIFVAFVASFLLPPQIFRYTNADVAPRVLTQVTWRAMVGSLIALAANVGVWFLVARGGPSTGSGQGEGLIEELYAYSFVAILLFHGFGGAVASHMVYLQQTKQYNSSQLFAMLMLVTLVLFVVILLLLALDWAIVRDAYVHLRDLTLITLIMVGYGRAVYTIAHH